MSAAEAKSNTPLLVTQGFKYVMSTIITCAAIAWICYGIGSGRAILPGPAVAHFAVLIFVLILLAYLEGLQVAILALELQSGESWKESHPRAYRLHSLVTKGNNVQRFLVGRQFYVVFVVFLCSQVTTFPSIHRPDSIPEVAWFILIETALPGALLVLAFGQLMPQLIASNYPVTFCNLPGAMVVLYITLILESVGITHFSWLLTGLVSWTFGLDKAAPEAIADTTSKPAPLLERLASIQDTWKRIGRESKLDLLDPTLGQLSQGQPWDKLFITPSMAEAGAQQVTTDAQWGGVRATPKADVYPTPAQIAEHLVAEGKEVPRFLLPPSHSMHVPPHILAYSLMSSMAEEAQKAEADQTGPEAVV